MSMDQLLASFYGTDKLASAPEATEEDLQKQASVELFVKVAASQGINIADYTDAQVDELYGEFMTQMKTAEAEAEKVAGEDEEHEEHESKKEERKEEAKKEHEEKKAAAEKIAEADYLGRVMAHSFVQESQKIAAAQAEAEKVAGTVQQMRTAFGAHGAAKGIERSLEAARPNLTGDNVAKLEKGIDAAKHLRDTNARSAAKTVGKGVAGTAAVGAAAYGAKKLHDSKKEKKEASALDELAGEAALNKAAEAGFDTDEAAARLSAVLTLGLGESEKIASASDVDGAIEIRSLELLEAAGYPVTWA